MKRTLFKVLFDGDLSTELLAIECCSPRCLAGDRLDGFPPRVSQMLGNDFQS